MDPFSGGSKLISIKKSVNAKQHIMPSLGALHAISGCDTVPMMSGIGKVKSLRAVEKVPLVHIGEVNAELEELTKANDLWRNAMVRLKQAREKTDEPFGLTKPMEQRKLQNHQHYKVYLLHTKLLKST